MKTDSEVTTVQIFKHTYKLRSGGNSEYVQVLAEYLDRRMVELSNQTPTVDSLKIAILAALSITDEFLTLQEEHRSLERDVTEKAERMNALLKPVVDGEIR
jgi:cell division protein ZapA